MGEEKKPKKMLHTKKERKWLRGRPRTRCIEKIRNDIELRGENREEIQEKKKRKCGTETAGDFSLIVTRIFGMKKLILNL